MIEGSMLLNKAIVEAVNLRVGEEFTIKDLFKGYIWKRIDKKDRLALGSEFFRFVKSTENLLPIKATTKTSSHKQKYIIKTESFNSDYLHEEYDEEDDDQY